MWSLLEVKLPLCIASHVPADFEAPIQKGQHSPAESLTFAVIIDFAAVRGQE